MAKKPKKKALGTRKKSRSGKLICVPCIRHYRTGKKVCGKNGRPLCFRAKPKKAAKATKKRK